MELIANFSLNNEALDAQFDISEIENFDALFQIYANPEKVSQLENDLNFQTGEQVASSIQAESDIINARIDGVVEAFDADIDNINERMVDTVISGSDLLEITRTNNTVTITPKTVVFEQATASDTWVISQQLNKKPSVTIVDSADTVMFPDDISYSDGVITLHFLSAFAGKAYLN